MAQHHRWQAVSATEFDEWLSHQRSLEVRPLMTVRNVNYREWSDPLIGVWPDNVVAKMTRRPRGKGCCHQIRMPDGLGLKGEHRDTQKRSFVDIIERFEERRRQVEKDISEMSSAPDFTQSVRDRLSAAVDAYGEFIASLKLRHQDTSDRHPPRPIIK